MKTGLIILGMVMIVAFVLFAIIAYAAAVCADPNHGRGDE